MMQTVSALTVLWPVAAYVAGTMAMLGEAGEREVVAVAAIPFLCISFMYCYLIEICPKYIIFHWKATSVIVGVRGLLSMNNQPLYQTWNP